MHIQQKSAVHASFFILAQIYDFAIWNRRTSVASSPKLPAFVMIDQG
jgi:hypothetical protein